MTIYLAILKVFLIKNISNWQTKSIAKDQSSINTVGSFFGMSRDNTLSKFKQDTASKLISDIHTFNAPATDLHSLNGIELLLTNAKNAAEIEAKKKGYSQGTFSKMINKTYNLAKDIFEKFKNFKLLELKYSQNDPFDIYRYYLSAYLAQKVYDIYHPSLLKYYTEHPNVSNIALLTQEREALVWKSLNSCINKLDRLDKSNNDYLIARKDSVLESIDALKRANVDLCKKHGVELALPLFSVGFASLNMGMPPLQPDSGCIELCMDDAVKMITSIKVITHYVDPKEKQIEDYFSRNTSNETSNLTSL